MPGRPAQAPAEQSAGVGAGPPVGAPYFDPAWGRYMVPLGGGRYRTATWAEAEAARSRVAHKGGSISPLENRRKGE